jgi:hypothetical protein
MHPTHPRRPPWPTLLLLTVIALLLALAAAVAIAPPVGARPLGRVVTGPSPLPWLAGAAVLAMAVVTVVRGARRRARERAAASSTSATVLPWPGTRKPERFDVDPDLPGGA